MKAHTCSVQMWTGIACVVCTLKKVKRKEESQVE